MNGDHYWFTQCFRDNAQLKVVKSKKKKKKKIVMNEREIETVN